jgi:hypothetical protein
LWPEALARTRPGGIPEQRCAINPTDIVREHQARRIDRHGLNPTSIVPPGHTGIATALTLKWPNFWPFRPYNS